MHEILLIYVQIKIDHHNLITLFLIYAFTIYRNELLLKMQFCPKDSVK